MGDHKEVDAEEEENVAAAKKITDDAKAEDADGEKTMESAQQYMDSAQELQEKLTLLQKLLDAKGEGVDPELKEKMDSLKGSLSSLGFTMNGVQDSLGGLAEGQTAITNELATGCLAMSVHRAGARRLSTLEGLRRFASLEIKPEDAKSIELVKLVAVCINEISQADIDDLKAGKAKALPKNLADKAKTEGEAHVLAFNSADWGMLRRAAKEMSGSLNRKKDDGGQWTPGFLAAIPVGCAVLFLTKKFLDMNREKAEAEEAKQRKKADKKK